MVASVHATYSRAWTADLPSDGLVDVLWPTGIKEISSAPFTCRSPASQASKNKEALPSAAAIGMAWHSPSMGSNTGTATSESSSSPSSSSDAEEYAQSRARTFGELAGRTRWRLFERDAADEHDLGHAPWNPDLARGPPLTHAQSLPLPLVGLGRSLEDGGEETAPSQTSEMYDRIRKSPAGMGIFIGDPTAAASEGECYFPLADERLADETGHRRGRQEPGAEAEIFDMEM